VRVGPRILARSSAKGATKYSKFPYSSGATSRTIKGQKEAGILHAHLGFSPAFIGLLQQGSLSSQEMRQNLTPSSNVTSFAHQKQ
jgi:hypothetical protein